MICVWFGNPKLHGWIDQNLQRIQKFDLQPFCMPQLQVQMEMRTIPYQTKLQTIFCHNAKLLQTVL